MVTKLLHCQENAKMSNTLSSQDTSWNLPIPYHNISNEITHMC